MSLLFGRTSNPPATVERSFVPPVFGEWFMGSTRSGQQVIPDNALRSAAVSACRRVIVGAILGMEVEVFQTQGDRPRLMKQQPLAARKPSARMSRRAWLSMAMNSMVLHGNAYLYVTSYDASGRPSNIEVLSWNDIRWSTGKDGHTAPFYRNEEQSIFPVGRLMVVHATPWLLPGHHIAQSPVELAKESIGTGLAAEEFGSSFFGDGAFPGSIIYSDQELTPVSAQGIKDRVMNATRGSREPAVLGSGLRWEQMSVDPKDSQFIELLRFEIEQACRFFGVPPSMAYAAVSGQAVTYVNIGQSDTQFFKHSLKTWKDDIEEGWSELLAGPQQLRLNVDSFLKMDAKDRHADQKLRLDAKLATINECRLEDDKDPFVELNEDGVNIYDLPGLPPGKAPPALTPESDKLGADETDSSGDENDNEDDPSN